MANTSNTSLTCHEEKESQTSDKEKHLIKYTNKAMGECSKLDNRLS